MFPYNIIIVTLLQGMTSIYNHSIKKYHNAVSLKVTFGNT